MCLMPSLCFCKLLIQTLVHKKIMVLLHLEHRWHILNWNTQYTRQNVGKIWHQDNFTCTQFCSKTALSLSAAQFSPNKIQHQKKSTSSPTWIVRKTHRKSSTRLYTCYLLWANLWVYKPLLYNIGLISHTTLVLSTDYKNNAFFS